MGPLGHTTVSVGIGAGVWAATGSPAAVPVAAATGVLIDVDHLLDYFNWYVRKDIRYLFLAFHAWEYGFVALALVLTLRYDPLLLAAALGYLGHIVSDHFANRPAHPLAYSIVHRVYVHFERERLFDEEPTTFSDALRHRIPLWRLIEPKLARLSSALRRTR